MFVVFKFGIDGRGNCFDFWKLLVFKCSVKLDYGNEVIFWFVMVLG